jgi:hypothetical protein
MRSFKKFVIESIEQTELDEAVEVRHDRYMRSHGKKASGGTGSWMFTHKAMGDVDHRNEKEVYSAPSGKFSDAKKSAQQWAKKHGHSTVYVMESVELDEKLKASDDMGDWVKDFQDSDAPQFKGKSQKKRQQMAVAAKLAAERNEEVELDEVSDKMLDRYRQKAFADQPSGDDGSDKYRKRKFGRDLAFAKQTGRAKVLATKEEVELDEVSQDLARKTAKARQQQASQLRQKAVDEPDMMKAFAQTKAANKAEKKAGQSYNRLMKKEEVDLTENVYEEVANYLVSEGIDLDNLSEAQLDELVGAAARALGRGIKRTFVNKKGNFRFSTAGRADAADAKAKKLEKARKDRERLQKARERIQQERQRAAQARRT